jgi:flagellin-like hook-associated protein FlgL
MGMVDSVSAAGLSGLQQLNLVSGLVRANALGRVDPPSGRTEPAVELVKRQFTNVAGARFVKDSLGTAEVQVTSAVNASSRIRDILLDLRELAARAQDGNLTTAERRRISSRFGELIGQVDKIVDSAGVEGRNLIAPGSSGVTLQTAAAGRTLRIDSQDLSISGLGFDESRFVARARVDAVDGDDSVNFGADDTAVRRAVGINESQLGLPANASAAEDRFNDELFVLDATRGAEAEDAIFRAIETLDKREAFLQEAANTIVPEIDGANRLINSLVDPAVRDLIDRDLTTEDAALAAVILGDELGSFRPPIANVDGQSIVGLSAGRGPALASGNTLPPLGTTED